MPDMLLAFSGPFKIPIKNVDVPKVTISVGNLHLAMMAPLTSPSMRPMVAAMRNTRTTGPS